MGLREKVTITLVIIAVIQIACRHCMPRSPRKASLKRYVNDLKPVKNNPVPTSYSPSQVNKTPKQTFGKTAQNARFNQNSLPIKSLYKTYNFPENEYPLDNSPRDPFRIGMNFNDNYHVNNLQKDVRNLGSSAINDLKKEMKIKRKLLSNSQINSGSNQLQRDMTTKFTPNPDSIRLLDSETFPEVQYPLNTMETWGPNYWNYLPFTQEKPFNRFEQQIFNPKPNENINKPFMRLSKATASKFLQSYDKLKEEQRHTSTENSKRSNVGQKGLNFTKTATCEKVSDDFITASFLSNIPSHSTEIKKTLKSTSEIIPSSENTCPVLEYSYHLMPIPYKVIEENTQNIFPAFEEKNNTEELQDVNNSVIAQTLQFIQEILLNDDTTSPITPENFSAEVEKYINTSECTEVPEKENIPTTSMDGTDSCTVTPIEELSLEVSDEPPIGVLQNNMPSHSEEITIDNTTTNVVPISVSMPLPSTEPITYEALNNSPNVDQKPLSNGNVVPGTKSIIIIPMNNNVISKFQSHVFESTSDTPIIFFIPPTQFSGFSFQTPPFNESVPLSFDKSVPNNKLYNGLSCMAPLQNDNPSSNALVSELLNGISDSGSSLPMYETLPTNSMCYNNENSPSSTIEKSFSNNLIHKSLKDDVPFVITTCEENSLRNESTEPYINTDTLPPILDFEHPLFDLAGSDLASLSHGPYYNIINNEFPITAREIKPVKSNQRISNVSCIDFDTTTQNVISEYSQKNISTDSVLEESLSKIPNDVPAVTLDGNYLPGTTTHSLEILKTNTPDLPNSLLNLPMPMDNSISSSPVLKKLTDSPPKPIDKILLSTSLIEAPCTDLPEPTETTLAPISISETVSDKLPVILEAKLPPTVVSEITTNGTLQPVDNAPAPFPIFNSYPNTTDNMTLNIALISELYKIRQLIDKVLPSETPTLTQLQPMYTTFSPISEPPLSLQTSPGNLLLSEVDKTLLPLPETDNCIDNLRPQVLETVSPIPFDGTPEYTLPSDVDKLLISKILLEADGPSLPLDETVLPTPVSENSTENKPYLIDNLVTPLSETVSFRTKNIPNDSFTHNVGPSKMDLLVPDIYEVSRDDLPLSINDLPIMVHQAPTANQQSTVSIHDGPVKLVKTTTALPEDHLNPTNQLSLPIDEVLEDDLSALPVNAAIPGAISLSLNNLGKLSDEVFLESILSDSPCDDFLLPVDNMLPCTDETSSDLPLPINKTPSMSKLPITKALLENVLSDITNGSLSSPVAKPRPVTPPSLLDKTLSYVDAKFLLPGTKEIPVQPVENIFSNIEHTDHPIDDISFSEKTEGTSNTYLPTGLPLSMDEMQKDKPNILTNDVVEVDIDGDVESPLSDITKDSPPQLVDKTNNIEFSDHSTDNNNLECSGQSDNTLPLEESLPKISSLDIPKEISPINNILPNSNDNLTSPMTGILPLSIDSPSNGPLSKNKTLSSSKLLITKTLLENVLSDINTKGFSLPEAKALPVASRSQLDKTLYFLVSPLPDLPTDNVTDNPNLDNPTDELQIDEMYEDKSGMTEKTKDKDLNESLSSDNPTDDTDDLPTLIDKEVPLTAIPDEPLVPLSKPQLASRIPITKALLQIVLSDITDRGLAAKDLPITSLTNWPTKTIPTH